MIKHSLKPEVKPTGEVVICAGTPWLWHTSGAVIDEYEALAE
jgi:hypothetical protein